MAGRREGGRARGACGRREMLGRARCHVLQMAAQTRRHVGRVQIRVVDSRGQQLLHGERHAAHRRVPPIVDEESGQILSLGEFIDAAARQRQIGDAPQTGGDLQGQAVQSRAVRTEFRAPREGCAGDLSGGGLDAAQQRLEINLARARQGLQIAADWVHRLVRRQPAHFIPPPVELDQCGSLLGARIHQGTPFRHQRVAAEQRGAHLPRGEEPAPIPSAALRHGAAPVGLFKVFQEAPRPPRPAACAPDRRRVPAVRGRA